MLEVCNFASCHLPRAYPEIQALEGVSGMGRGQRRVVVL